MKNKTSKYVNYNNFYMLTKANFQKVEDKKILNEIKENPDFVSDSGSRYLYRNGYVYRYSNHFMQETGSCDWSLDNNYIDQAENVLGRCRLEDFTFMDTYITIYGDYSSLRKLVGNRAKIEECGLGKHYYSDKYYYKYLGKNSTYRGYTFAPSFKFGMYINL